MQQEDTAETRWMPIPGWEGMYDVSDDGRVYSRRAARVMSHGFSDEVYPQVGLSRGSRHYFTIHRLVLLAFVGPCPEGMEGCHADDNPTNNHLDNLRWDTRSGNARDSRRNGRTARGDTSGVSVLSSSGVLAIRIEYAKGEASLGAIGAKHGVSRQTIGHVVRGTTWAHVGGPRTRRGQGFRPHAKAPQ